MIAALRRPPRRHLRALGALFIVLAVALPGSPVAASRPSDFEPAGQISAPAFFTAATISPGVHVGSVDLSGLDEAGARLALTQAYASVGQGQVNVVADFATSAISYASINRHVDIDAAINQAFAVGRAGDPIAQLMAVMQTAVAGTSIEPTVVFDEAALTQRVNQVAADARKVFANARAIRTKTGFSTSPSAPGRDYDASAVLPHLISQLQDVDAPSTLSATLPGSDTQPVITDEQAKTAVTAAEAMSLPIVLANGGDTWTVPENVVHSWISFKIVNGNTIQIAFSNALIQKYVSSLAPKINRAAENASWMYGPKGVVVVPSKDGRKLDVAKTSRRIEVFLEGRAAGTVTIDKKFGPTVVATKPKLTTAMAQKQSSKFKLISTWTTYFQPAAHNGFGANIWVPAHYLDNQVVQPGQTFSFWGRVGEVSFARGYRIGGAIVNGHTQEGVALAGGICSTSTTLFNAALRAGLKMGERSNHYYYIKRYPVGLDATVSKTSGGGGQDMTFTNDTDYPILIKSFKTGGSVTFSLYGIPSGRKVTFSKPVIRNYRSAPSQVIPVNTVPTGRLVRIEYPSDGFDSWVTAFVRDGKGKLISNRTYVTHYGMVVGIQYIGSPNGQSLTVPSYAPGAQGG